MAGLRGSGGPSLDLQGLELPMKVLLGNQLPCLAFPFPVLPLQKDLSLDCQGLGLPSLEFRHTWLPGVEVVAASCCLVLLLLQLPGTLGKLLHLLAGRNLKI